MAEEQGEEIIWALADGFLLYWHPVCLSAILTTQLLTNYLQDVVRELDIRLFLRVSCKTLKHRRDNRNGYHTAGTNASYLCSSIVALWLTWVLPKFVQLTSVLFQPEGSFWEDPPGYWDDIVWPAYLKAHHKMFQNNDVEHGQPLVPLLPCATKAVIGEDTRSDQVVGADGSVERDAQILNGKDEQICGEPVDGLSVFEAENMDMERLFVTACERVLAGNR